MKRTPGAPSLKQTLAKKLHKEAITTLGLASSSTSAVARSAAAAVPSAAAAGANQRLLDQILAGHYPDATQLDPPFDGLARAGLAARIRRAGVSVDPAVVVACTTVGCVRAEMNRVNPGGR